MNNKELFERGYAHEIEENMCYLLQEYWDKIAEREFHNKYRQCPFNPVSFIKDFMKRDTYVNYEITDMLNRKESTSINLDTSNVVDGEYIELD